MANADQKELRGADRIDGRFRLVSDCTFQALTDSIQGAISSDDKIMAGRLYNSWTLAIGERLFLRGNVQGDNSDTISLITVESPNFKETLCIDDVDNTMARLSNGKLQFVSGVEILDNQGSQRFVQYRMYSVGLADGKIIPGLGYDLEKVGSSRMTPEGRAALQIVKKQASIQMGK
jgi:hypothetical protein